MFRILVADPLHDAAAQMFKQHADIQLDTKLKLPKADLLKIIGDYDALIVRSETQVTADVLKAGHRLQVVARAGVGVDNIDLDTATQQGIAVVNAPTGNTIAAAEHTIALMMAMARNIPQADASMKRGEWKRGDFMGIEVKGKTLGIVGLGRVGSEVAKRAQGMQMRTIGFDPYVPAEAGQRMNVELMTLEKMITECDFLTIHTPLTQGTKSLIGAKELASMKRGARLLNVARGGLIDEQALVDAVNSGHIAGAAIDVYPEEPPKEYGPLFKHPKIITVPHLGASTVEAQASVAKEAVEQLLLVLRGQPARWTVNVPFIPIEAQQALGPYLEVGTMLGRIAVQLAEGQWTSVTLRYEGEIASFNTAMLKSAALIGLLQPVVSERVNLVNAPILAQQRGLRVEEHKGPSEEQYPSLLTLEVASSEGTLILSGTFGRGKVHIVRVGQSWLDAVPDSPYMLFTDHRDRPGLIGAFGTIMGQHDVNISFMEVGRLEARGAATMVIGADNPIPPEVLAKLRAIPGVKNVKLVTLANGAPDASVRRD